MFIIVINNLEKEIINNKKLDIWFPLKYWYTQKFFNPDYDEPLIALQYHNVKIDLDFKKIDKPSIFSNGKFTLKNLVNKNKSVIFDLLSIEGGVGILDTEYEDYINEKTSENKLMYEICYAQS